MVIEDKIKKMKCMREELKMLKIESKPNFSEKINNWIYNQYADSLYIGTIMQRVFEPEHVNKVPYLTFVERGQYVSCVVKENAILYKTKNGGFVDFNELTKNILLTSSRIKEVNDINTPNDLRIMSKHGIAVLPSVEASGFDERRPLGVEGTYVDENSLHSYAEYREYQQKENSKSKTYKLGI